MFFESKPLAYILYTPSVLNFKFRYIESYFYKILLSFFCRFLIQYIESFKCCYHIQKIDI
nr:MAG TPA: hypothetical protein [Caudoviricetes sp.]